MALVERFLRRPVAMLKMPEAIARGLSPTAFLRELRLTTGGYRATTFYQDWHSIAGTEARKDRYKYIRRDRLPSTRFVTDVSWKMEHNFMYKFALNREERAREGKKPHFVNIMQDERISVKEAEQLARQRHGPKGKSPPIDIVQIELVGIWHRVEGLEVPTPSPFRREIEGE